MCLILLIVRSRDTCVTLGVTPWLFKANGGIKIDLNPLFLLGFLKAAERT